MNLNSLKVLLLSSCCIIAAAIQKTPAAATIIPKRNPDVVISEVCYWPKPNEPEWIELANVSDKPVDIKNWEIIDGQTLDIKISEQSLVMPPKSFLVIILDGKDKSATPFKNNRSTIHSAKGIKGNLLGDKGGQIALYSSLDDFFVPSMIHGFVAWGRSPGSIIDDAIIAERWISPQDRVIGTVANLIGSPTRPVLQGGTIGLVESGNKPTYSKDSWGPFLPSEINPGWLNTKRSVLISPLGGRTTQPDGSANIQVIWMEAGVKYHFQVFTDKACQHIFLDATQDGADYHLEKPIPLGATYYWRARLIYPDGTLSDWSEVRSITHKIKE